MDFLQRNDPLLRRNFYKTISWNLAVLAGVIIVFFVLEKFKFSMQFGVIILFLQIIGYYIHERCWQNAKLGLPTKSEIGLKVHNEVKANLFRHSGSINKTLRELSNRHKSRTIWLTGLSGSGKSTLSNEIEAWIFSNLGKVYVLDGDNTRLGINKDLSFSNEDRKENIRRVAEICRLFNEAGIIVIASFISPFEQDRKNAKSIIGEDNYIEIYLEASLFTCVQRDPKGLYQKALNGEIKDFTGVNSPYEIPEKPNLHLNTELLSIESCIDLIKNELKDKLFNEITC